MPYKRNGTKMAFDVPLDGLDRVWLAPDGRFPRTLPSGIPNNSRSTSAGTSGDSMQPILESARYSVPRLWQLTRFGGFA